MKKISVIVPIYNSENTLRDCIASIQTQKYSNVEIILVNDGSKDQSLAICNECAAHDKRIKIINEENGGVSCARNKGIAAATGDYITFVDADDMVAPDIYVRLAEIAEQGYEIVLCNYNEFNDVGYRQQIDQLSSIGHNEAISRMVITKLISVADDALCGFVWRTLFNRRLIINNDIKFTPNLAMEEDLQFLLNCLKYTNKIGLCLEYLYNYRKSSDSATGKYMPKYDSNMRMVNDWMMEYVKELQDNSDLIIDVETRMAHTVISNIDNVCKRSTPYGLMQRITYAYSLLKEEKYRQALMVASKHKERLTKKKYIQIILMQYGLGVVNVLFYTMKNKTLI